ncbi:MAG: class E sortase [Microbacteriaceae bacterium]
MSTWPNTRSAALRRERERITDLRRRRRSRLGTISGVAGELLCTAAAIVALYLLWSIVLYPVVATNAQRAVALERSREWASVATDAVTAASVEIPVTATPQPGEVFANLLVPRFGADFIRPIAEGTGADVLDDVDRGMGHYTDSQLPGELGNVAIASHRTAYGGALHLAHLLRVGDPIVLETADGWYVYRYRDTQYVTADRVEVLAAVPDRPDANPRGRILTMTTCNPFYSSAERLVAYAVFDSFTPRAAGPPAIVATVYEDAGLS